MLPAPSAGRDVTGAAVLSLRGGAWARGVVLAAAGDGEWCVEWSDGEEGEAAAGDMRLLPDGDQLTGPTKPCVEPQLSEGAAGGVAWGTCSMRGWRPTNEDAHCAAAELAGHPGVGFVAVFDGHNGRGVAARLPSGAAARLGAARGAERCELDRHLRCEVCRCRELERGAARVERAGHTVRLMRVGGTLAVSRALGDAEFKRNPHHRLMHCSASGGGGGEQAFLIVACDGVWDMLTDAAACGQRGA
eukprot:gene26546-7523_t